MENLFWNIFEKSGDINAFLAYKEYKTNNVNNTEKDKDKK
ncbi:YqzL family protein [[Clostridium] colinum]|nr:YqzL family protein [[Clostridium] colinum]